MKFYIVIPAHNEARVIEATLKSLLEQSHRPEKIVVVDDGSTDHTFDVVSALATVHKNLSLVKSDSSDGTHLPGAKVVKAFYLGYNSLDADYDILCKFDADLIFPNNYLETLARIFKENPRCGMAGGFCYIEKNNTWVLENLTNKDHIRGALKTYRKECFDQIDGLALAMGWDTADEIKAKFRNWQVITDESLIVKHLKPTGVTYGKSSKFNQGIAFYRMRYKPMLTFLAALKLGWRKKSLSYFINCLVGYRKAAVKKMPFILTQEEGQYMRKLRIDAIKKQIF